MCIPDSVFSSVEQTVTSTKSDKEKALYQYKSRLVVHKAKKCVDLYFDIVYNAVVG